MKTTRRKFIKSTLLAAGGSLFLPGFIKAPSYAAPLSPLNYKPVPTEWSDDTITLAWIGHSTVLINFFGKWIITDPVLSHRIGLYIGLGTIGPSRLTRPALSIEEIPKPDLILLSHAHMDHMDYPTLRDFADLYPGQIDVVTAYLTKDVIENLEWKSLTSIDWNQETTVSGIRIKGFEVKHFGWRFPWERDRSRGYMKDGRSYNAYIIDYNGKKIFFGGDTAMTDKFIAAREENPEIAIMPIGAYNPWIRNHCNPEEALKMAAAINAKYFVPIHTKTFKQSMEPFGEAIEWMKKSAPGFPIKIGLEEIGQTFTLQV